MTVGFVNTNLPSHLRLLKDEIEGYAREYGLDFFETIFEVIDADELNEIAAYGGFPTRYPHWSFGMQYEELSKSYSYGLSKIYEMVINNDPCYAYLMRCNHVVDQKLVMAHVYGHCDFFKNNAYFAHTTRKMMDEIANHGARIRRYAERFGEDEVEAFLDKCMSIDDLIDIHSVAIKRRDDPHRDEFAPADPEASTGADAPLKFKSKSYMDPYINPRRPASEIEDEARRLRERNVPSFPDHPEKDVLLFLIEHAPLKNWQRDVLSIVRDEAYYFYPQAQTKIMNEGWACVVSGTRIATNRGLIPAEELVQERQQVLVSDGQSTRRVYDWAQFADRETARIRTRRGLILGGSLTHRVLLPGEIWKPLGELRVGDRVTLATGINLWAEEEVPLAWTTKPRLTLTGLATEAGVSLDTVLRNRAGRRIRKPEAVAALLPRYEQERGDRRFLQSDRSTPEVHFPDRVSTDLAAFLGYLIGDGHISTVKRVFGLTTGDQPQAEHFAELVASLFHITARQKWDQTKWRVLVSSQAVQAFLVHLGLKTGVAARQKTVPECILRSPKPVVAAFLRALYDCDGYAGPCGVILSTSSEQLGEVVQMLLLNFGILSTRRAHWDGCWHVQTQGRSTVTFRDQIGFRLSRKQDRLNRYIEDRQWFKQEPTDDEVVAIEYGRSDVYDFSVETTHRYVAQGLINHNSFWHSTVMTQKALHPSELIDYADHHSGTMATSGRRLNPYKLGIELLRDIEYRWNTGRFGPEWDNCDDLDTKRNWKKDTGLGRQKIFEVRKIHNDITFIDSFLTPEFCVQHKLFSFNYQESGHNYVIESREFQKVKQRLLASLTNFGKPWIYVINGNHANRGELLLRHEYNGVELNAGEAKDTLANIQYIWGRPVHIETVVDDKPTLLSFDGTTHTQQIIGADNDPRRNPATPSR